MSVDKLDKLTKDNFKKAVIVFSEDNFTEEYTVKERSYEFTNEEKYFDPTSSSSSLHGTCLDKSEVIRLDFYIYGDYAETWEVEDVYIKE